MISTRMTLLSFLLLGLFSVIAAQEGAIAVIELEGNGISQVEASALTDRLRSEIMNVSGATMVERDEMEQILSEQNFQQTGCVSSSCMVELGQLIGAARTIGGSVSKVGSTFSVNVRIINVETGEIENSVNYDLTGVIDELLISGMRNVAQLLFAASESDYLELGKDYEYYEDGQLKAEGRSISGVKLGRWIYYYENGRIQKVGSYKDGTEIGVWTYYNENGGMEKVGELANGVENGEWTYYYENGRISIVGNYENGSECGKWTYYTKDGATIYSEEYGVVQHIEIVPDQSLLGKLFGKAEVIEYYPNGAIKAKAERRRNMVDGKRTVCSVDGEVLNEQLFTNGTGYYVGYYENGQIRTHGLCRDYDGLTMKKIGHWLMYSPEGDILLEIVYDNDGNVVAEESF